MSDWDRYFINMAHAIAAENESCLRRQVGAVLTRVSDHSVIATGYNGAPQGVSSCGSRGECRREQHEMMDRYDYCIAVHAEQNCLSFAAKHGSRTQHSRMYLTHKPCIHCLRMMIQAGVVEVVYDEDLKYHDDNPVYAELAERILMRQFKRNRKRKK